MQYVVRNYYCNFACGMYKVGNRMVYYGDMFARNVFNPCSLFTPLLISIVTMRIMERMGHGPISTVIHTVKKIKGAADKNGDFNGTCDQCKHFCELI